MPDWKTPIRERLAPLALPPSRELDIVEELSQHLQDRYRELVTGGATEDAAARATVAELDEADLIRDLTRCAVPLNAAPSPLRAKQGIVVATRLFGNARIPRVDPSGLETMVNRAMNVWGGGGAHSTYFKKLDEIIVDIFNRPVSEQPRGLCDMGCGDGTLLAHLYSVVKERTARGGELDQHPLIIVGADFNKVARRATKQTLHAARIPTFHVIMGDINRPAQLASDLEAIDLDIHDLMHIRSFLDHNRPYVPLSNYLRGSRIPSTTGAFAYLGDEIPADVLEENLVRHLRRWKPYVGRFGLLVLELHTLPPALTAANLDRTPAVAYDATHGFSDQYLVELPVFAECAREAGLRAEPRWQTKFPPSELATVSLNYFTAG